MPALAASTLPELSITQGKSGQICPNATLEVTSKQNTNAKIMNVFFTSPNFTTKRRTAEMTWGETATRKLKFNGQREKKVAVSPSRPMTCCAAPSFQRKTVQNSTYAFSFNCAQEMERLQGELFDEAED